MTEKTERKYFIENGKPVGMLGGMDSRNHQEEGAFVVTPDERWGNPVFADACLDDCDFHIYAKLTLERLAATGVSILLGGHYHYNWSRPEGNLAFRICLDEHLYPANKGLDKEMYIVHGRTDPRQPWSMRENLHEKVVIGPCREFFQPGKPFTIDLIRRGDELTCEINGKEAFRTDLSDGTRLGVGRCGDDGWPISIGFLPARGTLKIHDFYAEGSFPGPAFPACDAWVQNTHDYSLYRIPALCMTPSGRLLAFCEARRSYLSRGWQRHANTGAELLSSDMHCAMKSSDDGGVTWSDQIIIPQLARGTTYQAHNPTPLLDQDTGEIFLFSKGAYVMSSKDDGQTWSEPRSLADLLPKQWRNINPGAGNGTIQLRRGPFKGRLIASFYGSNVMALLVSDDHGKTWQAGACQVAFDNAEPSLVELSDGRLLVSPRHRVLELGRLFLFSEDGGATLVEDRYEPSLPMAGQGEVIAYESLETAAGTVRPIVFCGATDDKTRLSVAISLDDGQTWPISTVIDNGSAANLALVALPDGHIGVLYERDKYRRLSFQRVNLPSLINQSLQTTSTP